MLANLWFAPKLHEKLKFKGTNPHDIKHEQIVYMYPH